jgi:hypothetical protein
MNGESNSDVNAHRFARMRVFGGPPGILFELRSAALLERRALLK